LDWQISFKNKRSVPGHPHDLGRHSPGGIAGVDQTDELIGELGDVADAGNEW
jgi:hypothetical protein